MSNRIQENLKKLMAELPEDHPIRVVAVSKYASLDQILNAYDFGIRDFGENKIQDFENKYAQLPSEIAQSIRWHFLGHLQRNKIKKTLKNRFFLIHSIDSLALAESLSAENEKTQTVQPILLQLNLTRESQKTGFLEETLNEDFDKLIRLKGVKIKGFMALGPHTNNPDKSKQVFQHLQNLKNKISSDFNTPLPELSMGMSQDFHHAIECGATIIRIGSRIFGSL